VENLDLDSLASKEKEEVVFRMRRQLESLGQTPLSNESFFFKNINQVESSAC